jgi:predicted esterase
VRQAAEPRGILTGFHGYLENAAIQLARLTAIPGADRWTVVSVQGLHCVYRGRTQEVVASWMTRQDREIAIADNTAYAAAALALAVPNHELPVVYLGFSQGGQMAFRAGVRDESAVGIVSVGSDVPPELLADASTRYPRVLLARAAGDEWYGHATHETDAAVLRARGVDVESVTYTGGHEWTEELSAAIGCWLRGAGRQEP